MSVKPGSLPQASSSGRSPRVQSVATGMSAPRSGPKRAASGALWSRTLPDVELHDEAVVEAHARELVQHVRLEAARL